MHFNTFPNGFTSALGAFFCLANILFLLIGFFKLARIAKNHKNKQNDMKFLTPIIEDFDHNH